MLLDAPLSRLKVGPFEGSRPGLSGRCAVAAEAERDHPRAHLASMPTLNYRQVGELLSMPVGSLGPIRARSLTRLARHPELRALNN